MPTRESALPGRETRMKVPPAHFVLGTPLEPPFPDGMELALFGLGCYWGAERKFWEVPGVHSTAAGYAAGITPNPTYEEVCSGMTGHNAVVRVVSDPNKTSHERPEERRVGQACDSTCRSRGERSCEKKAA